jgi:hypothetical protein
MGESTPVYFDPDYSSLYSPSIPVPLAQQPLRAMQACHDTAPCTVQQSR